jgi:predicted hexulose-6-phosphate isomerase
MQSPNRPFGIYEKALMPNPWERMFADVAEAGYEYFELSLDESDERLARLRWTREERKRVVGAARDNGIRIFSACFSGHRRFPLGSSDKAVEARAMTMFREGVDLCAALGIRVLQIAGYDVFYEPHSESTAQRYIDNLAKGVEWAERAGVMLAIEPVEKFLTTVRATVEVVRRIDSPWLQVYPDVSNMMSLGMDPVPELLCGRGRTVAVHVRDSLPDFFYNVPLGEGILDFEAVFAQLDRIGYRGPLVVEMWNQSDPEYLRIIVRAREFMLAKIAAARQAVTSGV